MQVRNQLLNSIPLTTLVAGAVILSQPATAQNGQPGPQPGDAIRTPPVEMGWRPISGTHTPTGEVPTADFWYVRASTIARSANTINFDVYANREYVRYSANCRSRMMSRILQGYINRSGQVIATRIQEEFFPADNSLQRRLVLDYACSQPRQ